MDGRAHIPPTYTGLSQYPTTTSGDGGDESSNRTTMPPPSGSSLAPFPPCPQFPPTDQASQYGSQNNFIPGSSPSQSMLSQPWSSSKPPVSPSSLRYSPSATVANKEMTPPPYPYAMINSSAGGSGSSLPLSVFSPPSSATVANNDMALAPIPYMTNDHKRGSSDNNIVSRLNALLAQNKQRTYPKPIEMPVGVRSREDRVGEKSSSHEDVNVDVVSNGNKRRAGNEIAPPNRTWSVSAGSSLNEKSSVSDEEPPPPPPPQGVSVDGGNDDAYGGMFTPDHMSKIAASDYLKELAVSDPKGLKRLLANREAAARSKERKLLRQYELEAKVESLETRIDTLTAELKLEKRGRMEADDECVRLKTRLDEGEEHARLRDALNEHLTGEVHRLTAEVSRVREEASRERGEMSRLREEVSEYRKRESERMNANMLEQLNINPQFQEKPPQQQTNYNFE